MSPEAADSPSVEQRWPVNLNEQGQLPAIGACHTTFAEAGPERLVVDSLVQRPGQRLRDLQQLGWLLWVQQCRGGALLNGQQVDRIGHHDLDSPN
jgi:hypothetical protein